MQAKGIFLTILSAITFGFAFTLAPLIYKGSFDYTSTTVATNPVTLTFLRNALSLPFLFVIVLFLKIPLRLNKKQAINIFILSVIGNAITTLLLNMAFGMIDVGIVTPIHFTYPIFVLLGTVLFFREKLTSKKILALVVSMLGIGVFFYEALSGGALEGDDFTQTLVGLILAVVSGVFYAFYIIFMDKSGLKSEPPFKISFYVALASSFAMAVYGSLTNELSFTNMNSVSWGLSIVFALLCTVVALSLLQIGIKHVGANTAAVITTFEPITSVVCGALILGEHIGVLKVVACLFIFAGVLILSFSKSK
ncbi:DMT family transporter [Campylobacter canadensis]|uniref:DMT family transporter n=1 Tax=Campylobacter canadensis TaxID=449520 RepID=A0ABS7WSQ6_9BACT|nr:DMT family transporter [Campylobacter canadensis]MBZ7987811.1 DMT family transporter [Campylobacter canadensis]MBZ7998932.1 DMT family transporter [Campylobacter canadensis]